MCVVVLILVGCSRPYNKAIKQENLQLAVFTAFNILASYKFPLIEALKSTGMIEEAFKVFGKHSFQHAIFYSNENCLRFELSEGAEFDSRISMFQTALDRTTSILELVFDKSETVSICLAFAGDSFVSSLSQFKELANLQCTIPHPTL